MRALTPEMKKRAIAAAMLWSDEHTVPEIAALMGIPTTTAWNALNDFHDLAGLPRPTRKHRAAQRRRRALALARQGLSRKTIAARLGTSTRSVKRYICPSPSDA